MNCRFLSEKLPCEYNPSLRSVLFANATKQMAAVRSLSFLIQHFQLVAIDLLKVYFITILER